MSLLITLKDKKTNKFLIASDGLYLTDYCHYGKTSPRTYFIQKFDNFIIGYNGYGSTFQTMVKEINFDKITTPITKGVILREIYPKLINILLEEKVEELNDQGILNHFDFDLIIMSKDGVFDIYDGNVSEMLNTDGCSDIYASGEDSIAFYLYNSFYEEMDTIELLKLIFKKTAAKYKTVGYPFMYVYQDEDDLHIINQDDKEEIVKLTPLWRK